MKKEFFYTICPVNKPETALLQPQLSGVGNLFFCIVMLY